MTAEKSKLQSATTALQNAKELVNETMTQSLQPASVTSAYAEAATHSREAAITLAELARV
jgi:hypothetical protein